MGKIKQPRRHDIHCVHAPFAGGRVGKHVGIIPAPESQQYNKGLLEPTGVVGDHKEIVVIKPWIKPT